MMEKQIKKVEEQLTSNEFYRYLINITSSAAMKYKMQMQPNDLEGVVHDIYIKIIYELKIIKANQMVNQEKTIEEIIRVTGLSDEDVQSLKPSKSGIIRLFSYFYDSLLEKYRGNFPLKEFTGKKKPLPNNELDAWLHTVSKNTLIDYIKKNSKHDLLNPPEIKRYKEIQRRVLGKRDIVIKTLSNLNVPEKNYFIYDYFKTFSKNAKHKIKSWKKEKLVKVKKGQLLVVNSNYAEELINDGSAIKAEYDKNSKSKHKIIKNSDEDIYSQIYANKFIPEYGQEQLKANENIDEESFDFYQTDQSNVTHDINVDNSEKKITENYGNISNQNSLNNLIVKENTNLMNKLIFDTTEKIGEKCKQLLHYFRQGLSEKEKALKLNIPVGTVKSRWNVCKKKIRLTMLSMNKDLIKTSGYKA